MAGIDDAAARANVVLDARNADRYRGEHEPVDPRPGHIPGARNVPCRENLTAKGTFRPADELRRRFTAAGVRDAAEVVSSCGSGVTACHNLLARWPQRRVRSLVHDTIAREEVSTRHADAAGSTDNASRVELYDEDDGSGPPAVLDPARPLNATATAREGASTWPARSTRPRRPRAATAATGR